MDFDPEDQEIIRLLTKIREAEGGYPEHMLVARRRSYLKRMTEINLGIAPEPAISHAAKDVKLSPLSPATATLVETMLVVAIVAEATAVAYFYRDRLADFFRRAVTEPRVQEVTPPPSGATSLELQGITPSPALTVTDPSVTTWVHPTPTGIAVTPTSTPIPGVSDNSTLEAAGTIATGQTNVLNATPGLNDNSGNNGNSGNHYGQTPKPERTKENGNHPPPKENEDKPPKENEDKPQKDNNDKPPKD